MTLEAVREFARVDVKQSELFIVATLRLRFRLFIYKWFSVQLADLHIILSEFEVV